LQRIVLAKHRRAFEKLLILLPPPRRVLIVGGGLFPRTALLLRELAPNAHIVIMDANLRNLETAREMLGCDFDFDFVHRRYTHSDGNYDLVVIPLSFDGSRAEVYMSPATRAVIVHDWIWRRRGTGRIVSIALLKRLNLVTS
jgi:hypothetical protein